MQRINVTHNNFGLLILSGANLNAIRGLYNFIVSNFETQNLKTFMLPLLRFSISQVGNSSTNAKTMSMECNHIFKISPQIFFSFLYALFEEFVFFTGQDIF